MAQKTSVGDTKVVFHKDHTEIVHDKTKVTPSSTTIQIDLAEATLKMKAYVIPKLSKTGKDMVGEISALADKTGTRL